jgi:hypothetical protein
MIALWPRTAGDNVINALNAALSAVLHLFYIRAHLRQRVLNQRHRRVLHPTSALAVFPDSSSNRLAVALSSEVTA